MPHSNRPRAVHGPPLARLLADLAQTDLTQPRHAPSERLSQWLEWTHAVALANALDAAPAASSATLSGDDPCASLRTNLTRTIVEDPAFGQNSADASFYQQRCVVLQQRMEAGVADLRERLRQALSAIGPAQARLAAVDAALERTLTRRERTLLASIPAIVAAHCQRLLPAPTSPATLTTHAADDQRLEGFRGDVRRLLLAELDLRLQPVEGLSAALRSLSLESHAQKTA